MIQCILNDRVMHVVYDVVENEGYKGLKGSCNSGPNVSSIHGTSGVTNAEQIEGSGDTCSTPVPTRQHDCVVHWSTLTIIAEKDVDG